MDKYMATFYGGPLHKQEMLSDLLPEIRLPVMEDIKPRLTSTADEPPTNKIRCHVYERQIGTTDYIYKGIA